MTAHNPEIATSDADRDDDSTRTSRARSTLAGYARDGSLALLAGGVILVRAVRSSSRGKARTAARALVGAALLGVGLRQRRSERVPTTDLEFEPAESTSKTVSDDAGAARRRNDVLSQDEANPRGVSDEPDAAASADEGRIRFTAGDEEPSAKPHLDDDVPKDPRYADESDDLEIDLSEAAMADEASEATGPVPEQAEPVQTEDTEPDRSPPEDASHAEGDVTDGTNPDSAGEASADDPAVNETSPVQPLTTPDPDGDESDRSNESSDEDESDLANESAAERADDEDDRL